MLASSPVSRFMLTAATFVIVIAGMRAAESILVPFLLSLFIAVIASPPLLWLKNKGLPNGLAMLIVIGIIVINFILIGMVVGASITDFRQDLPQYQERLTLITADLFTRLESLGLNVDVSQLRESFKPSAALAIAGNTLAQLGNMMTNAFLILLLVIFILAEEVNMREKIQFGIKNSSQTLEAIGTFTTGVNQYIAIKTTMSALTGAIILIWLWAFDIEYFVLWGLLAFLLNYIPTFGSILAAVPAILLAVVQVGIGQAAFVGLGFLLTNVIVGNVIEPRVMGRGLGLSALVVFLSLVFWGWVLGPIGMLLSIPLTMTVKIALESFEDTRWLGIMMGSGVEAHHKSQWDTDTDSALKQLSRHKP